MTDNKKDNTLKSATADDGIVFETEDGTAVEFRVVEQTTLGGINYLFVIDKTDDESFLILRENAGADTEEIAAYDIVEDEKELDAVIKIFDELLEDVNLEV